MQIKPSSTKVMRTKSRMSQLNSSAWQRKIMLRTPLTTSCLIFMVMMSKINWERSQSKMKIRPTRRLAQRQQTSATKYSKVLPSRQKFPLPIKARAVQLKYLRTPTSKSTTSKPAPLPTTSTGNYEMTAVSKALKVWHI